MRRWNGWGSLSVEDPFPESGLAYLERALGRGRPAAEITLQDALAAVPASRLPDHPLIRVDSEARLLHARGQSLPDWVALRSGRVGPFPDGVAWPENTEQVRTLLALAEQVGGQAIPYGGGTSVVGHINPLPGDRPVLTIDLSRMARLVDLDERSLLATFETGASGPQIESQLGARGFTLGHYPQSWEHSTLGGWIATRSSGQQSLGYGRIEDLFAGGTLETPIGSLSLPAHPASAAGPDLHELVLGSEGRLGVITRAVIRVRPLPARERFLAAFLPDWEAGIEAARAVAQSGVPLSMLRVSDSLETEVMLALSGGERLARLADRALRLLGLGDRRCLLIYAATGGLRSTARAGQAARAILRRHGALPIGAPIGEAWKRNRFRAPYLRNSLWTAGYALDTLETALPWSGVLPASEAIASALRTALDPEGEPTMVLTHLSHLYPDGASLYFTFLFRLAPDPDLTLQRWRQLKGAASQAIQAHGGTISHQHGVGLDHLGYLPSERGEVGMHLLRAVCQALDPQGIMNPGKLLA